MIGIPSRETIPETGSYSGPLPADLRRHFERIFAQDFAAIRIHVDRTPEHYGALAFAAGADIVIAPGYYAPHTQAGIRLLGHELAHVIQQAQGRVTKGPLFRSARVLDIDLEAEADEAGAHCVAHFFGTPTCDNGTLPASLRASCTIARWPSDMTAPVQCVPVTAAASYAQFQTDAWAYLQTLNGTAIGALNHQQHMSRLYQIYTNYTGHHPAPAPKVALAGANLNWQMIEIIEATFAGAPMATPAPLVRPARAAGMTAPVPAHNNIVRIQTGGPWPQINNDVNKNALLTYYYSQLPGGPPHALAAGGVRIAQLAQRAYLHIYPQPRRAGSSNWRIALNVPPDEIAEAVRRLMPVMNANANIDHIKFAAPTLVTKPDSVIIYMRGATLTEQEEIDAYVGPSTPVGIAAAIAVHGVRPTVAQAAAMVAPPGITTGDAAAAVGRPLTMAEAQQIVGPGGAAAATGRVAAGNAAALAAKNATLMAVVNAVFPAAPPLGAPTPLHVVPKMNSMLEEFADGGGECAEPPKGAGSFGSFRSVLAYQAYLLMRKQFCRIRWSAANFNATLDALYNFFGIPAPATPHEQNRLAQPFFSVRAAIFTGLKAISDRGTVLENR